MFRRASCAVRRKKLFEEVHELLTSDLPIIGLLHYHGPNKNTHRNKLQALVLACNEKNHINVSASGAIEKVQDEDIPLDYSLSELEDTKL